MKKKNLMRQALYETYLCGHDLKRVCANIQEQIQQGEESKVLANMKEFPDGVGCISQALHMTEAVHQDGSATIFL